MPGDRLFVPDAVLHRGDGALGECGRGRRDRAVGVHRLRRDDSEVAPWHLGGFGGRADTPDHVPRPGQAKPVGVDRVDVRPVEVVRPHLDVREQREIGREQRPHRATTDDADPHRYEASLARTSA